MKHVEAFAHIPASPFAIMCNATRSRFRHPCPPGLTVDLGKRLLLNEIAVAYEKAMRPVGKNARGTCNGCQQEENFHH